MAPAAVPITTGKKCIMKMAAVIHKKGGLDNFVWESNKENKNYFQ
jgi:hypothetical protein